MRSELTHIFVALLHRRDWTVRLPVSSSYSNGKFSDFIFALEDGSCKRRNRTFTEDLGNEKGTCSHLYRVAPPSRLDGTAACFVILQ